MEDINCILCGSENHETEIEENGYKGRKCAQCKLIYISPRPSFDQIAKLYGHDDAHIPAQGHIAAEFLKRLYARHSLGIVKTVCKGGNLLEIGAGAGYFLDEARKLGFQPHAIELNPAQANFIRENLHIPCEESALSTSLFQGKRFDVLYHCDVTSHFFDPISEFRKMNEVLVEGGFLVFETGNLGEVEQKRLKRIPLFQYPDHLFFFGERSLRLLLDKAGFSIVRMFRYSIMPQLLIGKVLWRLKRVLSVSDDSRAPSYTVWRYLSDTANYLARYKFGHVLPKRNRPQTVIVVARKAVH
jgi:SAM-dependent methyltransferase